MIAMVAMAPIIALQILGFVLKLNLKREGWKAMLLNTKLEQPELICFIVNFG